MGGWMDGWWTDSWLTGWMGGWMDRQTDGWMDGGRMAGQMDKWMHRLTEDGPGRDGLLVDPEGDLGQDDRHDAGDVGLDEEEAHLPLQVEVNRHDDVLTWRRTTNSSRSSISGSGGSQEVGSSLIIIARPCMKNKMIGAAVVCIGFLFNLAHEKCSFECLSV